ncbi:Manganese-transporting ATPase 13A1, partial [Fragariocoptes setiger]
MGNIDDLVEDVSTFTARPLLLHGYLFPFAILQAIVYYLFNANVSTVSTTNTEDWLIAVAIVVASQIIVFLFTYWSIDVKCFLCYNRISDPYQAQYVKVRPTPNNGSTELLKLNRDNHTKLSKLWFIFQKTKYVYSDERQHFEALEFECNHELEYYKQCKGYDDPSELQHIKRLYGRNEMEMVVPEFGELFKERALAPFFVFQVFCVGLWCMDEYWYYALFTLLMLVTFEIMLVKHQMRNMQEIRRMGNRPHSISVFRQRKWRYVKSDQLVQGDLVCIQRSTEHNVPCDIILLRGSCIVDESTLTGESVPQMKEPIDALEDVKQRFDLNVHGKLHVLFGGTRVLQHTPQHSKDQGCIGYVMRTGFQTAQGKLLRTILFGVKRVTANNFETFCFILFLLVFAIAAAVYVWTRGSLDGTRSRYRLFFECTVIITSVVPPELPIELSLAVNQSIITLSKLFIYCTEPFRIPFAGKVEYCCFDKTGTLTSDDLLIEGIAGLPASNDTNKRQPGEEFHHEKDEPTTNEDSSSKKNLIDGKQVRSIKDCHGVRPLNASPVETLQVLATCHSLAHLDDGLVGDPLEKKILEAIDWNYTKSGTVAPRRAASRQQHPSQPLKIVQRFHFNSTLKRMSVMASTRAANGTGPDTYVCCVKGAPEVIKPMLVNAPAHYNSTYMEMSRLGARVLALARRNLGHLSDAQVRELTRYDIERSLEFCGFVLITCPLKEDSRAVSLELLHSGHRLMMITGDAPLTACHVAASLEFITKPTLILTTTKARTNFVGRDYSTKQEKNKEECTDEQNDERETKQIDEFKDSLWQWTSIDESTVVPFKPCVTELKRLISEHDLCLTGDALSFICEMHASFASKLIQTIKVFARVSPKQKETIVTSLKGAGHHVLMCGDGTNDVGALKHAHVGVALLSTSSPSVSSGSTSSSGQTTTCSSPINRENNSNSNNSAINSSNNSRSKGNNLKILPPTAISPVGLQQQRASLTSKMANGSGGNARGLATRLTEREMLAMQRRDKVLEAQRQLKAMLEEQDRAQLVKLGDASIAAPFTSRLSSVQCICHIIKQGRCTLVTTLQMFKILALNALMSAYCHSVMYLDGIKFSDGQVTLQGLLSTACFLFITRSKPLAKLHQQRPLPNIFNAYTLLTVLSQFLVHFGSLVYLYEYAKSVEAGLAPQLSVTNTTLALESPATSNNAATNGGKVTTQLLNATDGLLSNHSLTTEEILEKTTTEFKPSLVNSTVYIIWLSLQISTFIVNYKGHPFMQNLSGNRPLLYSFVGSVLFIVACIKNWAPELREQFSLVTFTSEFQNVLLTTVAFDLVVSYVLDRVCDYMFARVHLRPLRL